MFLLCICCQKIIMDTRIPLKCLGCSREFSSGRAQFESVSSIRREAYDVCFFNLGLNKIERHCLTQEWSANTNTNLLLWERKMTILLEPKSKMDISFYRAALNVRRKLTVWLSVCLSLCQTRALWQNGKKDPSRFLHHTKDHFSLVFWEEKWLMGRPFLPKILGQPAHVGAKSLIFNRYSLVGPQP